MDCFAAPAMAGTHLRILAARYARGLLSSPALFDQRAQGMPGARCTRSLVCAVGSKYAHEYSQRVYRNHPAFPAQWFTAYTVLSPVIGFLATVAGGVASTDLTTASGRQDHRASPSPSSTLVRSTIRVHRIPPRAGDVAQRPSEWDWMAVNIEVIWVFGKPEYFCQQGWTSR